MTAEQAALLLAASRWLSYSAVLGLVGASGAWLVVRRITAEPFVALAPMLAHRLRRTAAVMAGLWIVALLAMLAANVISWFGPAGLGDPERIDAMLFQTTWGRSWINTFASAVAAGAIAAAAIRIASLRPLALILAPAAAVVPTPLIGHAAGHGTAVWALHSMHLLGAGLWLGTLLVLVWQTWTLWRASSPAPAALRQVLVAFSPIALAGAALAASSGGLLSVEHVWPPATAFETAYGITLAVKIAIVAAVAALGWLNWRRLGPRAGDATGRRQLRRAVALEIVLGFAVVLAVTAWLTGLETPM
jgi:putative copper resistance protein D